MEDVQNSGAPGSSVGRASDSGSRSPGVETRAGHLVVGSNSTKPALSEVRCAGGNHTTRRLVTLNSPERFLKKKQQQQQQQTQDMRVHKGVSLSDSVGSQQQAKIYQSYYTASLQSLTGRRLEQRNATLALTITQQGLVGVTQLPQHR